MNKLKYESDLYNPISNHIKNKGFRWQRSEVRFYDYRIDMCGYSSGRNQVIAVELKLHNWKRALEQTLIYQLCADVVYAALPKAAIRESNIEAFAEHGIGLFGVSDKWRCFQVLEPSQSLEVRDWYRTELISNLTANQYESC